jgi:hypothetical protein
LAAHTILAAQQVVVMDVDPGRSVDGDIEGLILDRIESYF